MRWKNVFTDVSRKSVSHICDNKATLPCVKYLFFAYPVTYMFVSCLLMHFTKILSNTLQFIQGWSV